VIALSDTMLKLLAAVVPNVTALAPVKPLPLTVTSVPPIVLPDVGVIAVTTGLAAAVYVNRSAPTIGDVPEGVVTVMSTIPAAWGGAVAMTWVSDSTVKLLAAWLPNDTCVAPVKLVPVILMTAPPAVLPDAGVMADTAGTGAAV
jgi:hypothetical protein